MKGPDAGEEVSIAYWAIADNIITNSSAKGGHSISPGPWAALVNYNAIGDFNGTRFQYEFSGPGTLDIGQGNQSKNIKFGGFFTSHRNFIGVVEYTMMDP